MAYTRVVAFLISEQLRPPLSSETALKGREIEANREGPRSFAMNQKRPTRASLEGRTGSMSILLYSVEGRLNLPV
jgi:hypothetical protein